MKNNKNLPISAKVYLKLRPLIIPFEKIEKHVSKKGTIVDLGCGFGIFANFLATQSSDREVIGIDLNGKRILVANKIFGHLSNLNFICSNITDTKIPKTDTITAVDVLHHIPSLELQTKLLRECHYVLSEGGRLILKDLDTKPRWKYVWNRIHDYIMTGGEPVLYQNQNGIEKLLNKTGFKLEKKIGISGYPYAHIIYVARKSK